MKNNPVVVVVVAVLVVTAAFFGGIKYDQFQSGGLKFIGAYGQGRGANGMGGANANRGGRNGVMGEVLSMDDKSVTLKIPGGGSKIILLSEKTQVMKSISGLKTDLKAGLNLIVNGVSNTDGSVTADTIQIRPEVVAVPAIPAAK